MPETIRTVNDQLRSLPRRGGVLAGFLALAISLRAVPAFADAADSLRAFSDFTRQDIVTLTLILGVVCFAVLSAVVLVRTRQDAARANLAAQDEMMALRAEVDRVKAL